MHSPQTRYYGKVLIADDDRNLVKGIKRLILSAAKGQLDSDDILVTENAADALSVIKTRESGGIRERVFLAFLDLKLPSSEGEKPNQNVGVQLMTAIHNDVRRNQPHICVISGSPTSNADTVGLKQGDYIEKGDDTSKRIVAKVREQINLMQIQGPLMERPDFWHPPYKKIETRSGNFLEIDDDEREKVFAKPTVISDVDRTLVNAGLLLVELAKYLEKKDPKGIQKEALRNFLSFAEQLKNRQKTEGGLAYVQKLVILARKFGACIKGMEGDLFNACSQEFVDNEIMDQHFYPWVNYLVNSTHEHGAYLHLLSGATKEVIVGIGKRIGADSMIGMEYMRDRNGRMLPYVKANTGLPVVKGKTIKQMQIQNKNPHPVGLGDSIGDSEILQCAMHNEYLERGRIRGVGIVVNPSQQQQRTYQSMMPLKVEDGYLTVVGTQEDNCESDPEAVIKAIEGAWKKVYQDPLNLRGIGENYLDQGYPRDVVNRAVFYHKKEADIKRAFSNDEQTQTFLQEAERALAMLGLDENGRAKFTTETLNRLARRMF
jgi:HAD superfamily phosphoserine phosphatase-like hydrolase